jgi:hypothetical protein
MASTRFALTVCGSKLKDHLGDPLIAGFLHAAFVRRHRSDFLLDFMAVGIDFLAANFGFYDGVFDFQDFELFQ